MVPHLGFLEPQHSTLAKLSNPSVGYGPCSPPAPRRTSHASRSASTSATARACTRSGSRSSTRTQWSEGELTSEFEAAWARLERPRRGRVQRLDRRRARRARVGRRARRDRALPVEHVHGDAARRDHAPARGSSSSTATATTSACRSTTSSARSHEHKPRAVFLVHIGGHIAFDSQRIAELCRGRGHRPDRGLRARARRRAGTAAAPGTFGDVGVWSFAPTKTISTGEGGMLVSRHAEALEFARAVPQLRQARLRGAGLNFRLNEFTAAIGIVQTERLPEIVALEERGRPRARRPAAPVAAPASRRDGLRPLQGDRLRADRAVDRQGLRRAVPPRARPRRRPAEHRLGRRESLVRAALLPARAEEAMR